MRRRLAVPHITSGGFGLGEIAQFGLWRRISASSRSTFPCQRTDKGTPLGGPFPCPRPFFVSKKIEPSPASFAQALETSGYEPLPVRDGGQAMEVLKQQHADLVLLDVSLPREDGFEVLAQMRALPETSELPVLMLCEGDITADLEERAKMLGAVGVAPASMGSDQLLSRVGEFVSPRRIASAASGFRLANFPLPDSGSLRTHPFPELLHELHQSSFSGVLLVQHGRKRKAIEFREGWPICVKSNLISECLGGYLVKSGRCTQAQVEASVAQMKLGKGLQGEILVAMEVLEEADVVAALEQHALEKLFEVFSWPNGDFALRPEAEVQRGSAIALRGHPSSLIMEGGAPRDAPEVDQSLLRAPCRRLSGARGRSVRTHRVRVSRSGRRALGQRARRFEAAERSA